MKRTTGPGLLGLVAAIGLGCGGAGIGSPCTVRTDCPGLLCDLNQPGGYCTQQCTPGQDSTCPGGSTCISNGYASGLSTCFKICQGQNDCRNGYSCVNGYHGNTNSICVVP